MPGLRKGGGAENLQTTPNKKEMERATVVPERNPVELAKGGYRTQKERTRDDKPRGAAQWSPDRRQHPCF